MFRDEFKVDCPLTRLRGLKKHDCYARKWFNPPYRRMIDKGDVVEVDSVGMAQLPEKLDRLDWGLYAKKV